MGTQKIHSPSFSVFFVSFGCGEETRIGEPLPGGDRGGVLGNRAGGLELEQTHARLPRRLGETETGIGYVLIRIHAGCISRKDHLRLTRLD